jgi:hypothetical protein
MNRVLVFLLALAVVAGIGVVAFLMFDDSGPKSKGTVDVPVTTPKPPTPAAGMPGGPPITSKAAESAPIKTTSFVDTPGAFHEAGIMGVVQNEAGARIEGALCELFEDTSALKDRSQEGELREKQATNAEGLFFFDRNALSLAERYLLKVTHPMFVTERKPVDIKKSDTGVVYVTMRPGASISGTVRNATGAGVPNATVTVYDMNQNTLDPNGSVETWVSTDPTGTYTVAHVGPGMKKVQASAPAYATAGKQAVNVEAGRSLSSIDFTMNEGGAISGQLVSSEGVPIQGAFVTARPVRIGPRVDPEAAAAQAVSDIQSKREADVRDRERAMKLQEAVTEEDEHLKEEMRREREEKSMGNKEAGLKSEAMRKAATEMKEREAQAVPHPMPGVKRAPMPAQAMLTTVSVRSQADGTFTITGTEVGTYVVSVNAPGYMPPPQQTVESPAQGVSFTLQPNARIIGKVVDDETGRPVTMFTIGLTMNPDDVLIPAYSKKAFGPPKFSNGAFEYLDVKPGKVWLVADSAGYAGGRSSEIVVSQGEKREGVEIRLVRGGTIKGRVVDAKGAPVPNATISPEPASLSGTAANPFIGILTQSMRRDVREVTTDSEGRFSLPNMLSGSYTLSVRHPDFGPHTTAPFTVQGSGETGHPDITLARGATIRGRVRLPDGLPDTKAMVQVSPMGGTPTLAGHRSAYTDSEGRFEVNGLAVGQYRVIVAQRNGTPDIGGLFKGLAQSQQGVQPQNVFTVGEGEVKELDL